MSYFFNAGRDLNGICFMCLNRDTELCEKCMMVYAKKFKPMVLVENNEYDPYFQELYDKISEETALALEIDGDGQP